MAELLPLEGARRDMAILRELELCRVQEPALSRLAATLASRGIAPLRVRKLWKTSQKARTSPTGLLIARLDGDVPAVRVTPTELVQWVTAGDVVAIDGHPVRPQCVRPVANGIAIYAEPCAWVAAAGAGDGGARPVATVEVEGLELWDLTLSGHEARR